MINADERVDVYAAPIVRTIRSIAIRIVSQLAGTTPGGPIIKINCRPAAAFEARKKATRLPLDSIEPLIALQVFFIIGELIIY